MNDWSVICPLCCREHWPFWVGDNIWVDRGCSQYGIKRFNKYSRHLSVPLPLKCRITCVRVILQELENLCITFDAFVGLAAHQTVFYDVACNSNSETLAALQTRQYKLQFVPKDIVLTPISFRSSRLVRPSKGLIAIWIPVGLSSGLPP